jgi:hypothetical protein
MAEAQEHENTENVQADWNVDARHHTQLVPLARRFLLHGDRGWPLFGGVDTGVRKGDADIERRAVVRMASYTPSTPSNNPRGCTR